MSGVSSFPASNDKMIELQIYGKPEFTGVKKEVEVP
jgi:hypothetical protein